MQNIKYEIIEFSAKLIKTSKKKKKKNETEIVLRLSSNIISDSNDKTNFPHEYY